MGAHPYAGTAGGVAGGLIPGAAAALLTGGTGDAAMLAADAGKVSTGSQLLRGAAERGRRDGRGRRLLPRNAGADGRRNGRRRPTPPEFRLLNKTTNEAAKRIA